MAVYIESIQFMTKGLKAVTAFLSLIRFPNLLFISLTQVLFYFKIIGPVFSGNPLLSVNDFFLLMAASVMIAAAGYIINDYFDMDIDFVNKPNRMVIGRFISRRWAMLLHMLMSLAGLYLTAVVSMHLNNLFLLFMNFFSVFLLLLYSSTFKKKLIIGNVIISILTAWVIISLFVASFKWGDIEYLKNNQKTLSLLYKYTLIYAAFAFMVSLIREVVKDAEDQIGDKQFGCTTMPIKWGETPTKIFLFVWLVVLAGLLLSVSVYILFSSFSLSDLLFAIVLFAQLILLTLKIRKASTVLDYTKVSRQLKLFMLTGILSMLSL